MAGAGYPNEPLIVVGDWPAQPVIYEVNTWVWLDELSRTSGRAVDLGTVDAKDWDAVAVPGVDAVWLMGVWERSPVGRAIALHEPDVHAGMEAALADLRPEDVVGSPYCVRRYQVDEHLGGDDSLARARMALAERGVRLIVDYVPNHVAPDHPWTRTNQEYFVHGTDDEVATAPAAFVHAGDGVLALARDPHFPPWQDVVQLNAFDDGLRAATAATLTGIADRADGVRCDMAMLMVNEVFARTWGQRAGPVPRDEFWPGVIAAVRNGHPGFAFVAEVYWDMEAVLLEQGFDHCYDKQLYDALVAGSAAALRHSLRRDIAHQRRLVRFAENHDEPRSAAVLPYEALRAAAITVTTVPGATLLYEGQLEGRKVRPPVQLGRRPDEPVDGELLGFWSALLAWLDRTDLRSGEWSLLDVSGWPDNATADHLVAWSWTGPHRYLVVVNYSASRAQGQVGLPWDDFAHTVVLDEALVTRSYERDGVELMAAGLYVDLPGHGFHILHIA